MKKRLPIIIIFFFLLVYLLFPSRNSSIDAYYYAASIRYSGELFHPHHLLYNPTGYLFLKAVECVKIFPDVLGFLKIMNALVAGVCLIVVTCIFRQMGKDRMEIAGFLILTGAIIGTISQQRENRIRNLRRSYVGSLEILLKYMEVADEVKPRSLRVARLAGKMAEAAGLEKREVENIKSAALLYEAGDLQSSLHFFSQVVEFMASDKEPTESGLSDRENVMLKSTASLLKEVEPLLYSYFHHYVEEAHLLDKDLDSIPLGSALIALADIHDRLSSNVPPLQEAEEYGSKDGIERLAGRAFPHVALYALHEAAMLLERSEN